MFCAAGRSRNTENPNILAYAEALSGPCEHQPLSCDHINFGSTGRPTILKMHEKSIAYAAYWRNSLADAELGRGTLTKDEVNAHRRVLAAEAESGILHEDTVEAFFAAEDEKVRFVEVVYRPLLYAVKNEHGQRASQLPEFVTPLVTQALLSREGCLLPKPSTVVPRDILQPLEAGSFYIGTIEDLDRFLTDGQVPGISFADVSDGDETQLEEFRNRWKAYRDGLDGMLAEVCETFVSQTRQFLPAEYGLVLKQGSISGATQHVVRLYDHIRDKRPQSPLFESYARVAATHVVPCLPANAGFASRLGHSSDTFALADAQRAALSHLAEAKVFFLTKIERRRFSARRRVVWGLPVTSRTSQLNSATQLPTRHFVSRFLC